MSYDYLFPLVIPYIIFYLIGICLIIIVFKRHLDNKKVVDSQKNYFFDKKVKVLMYFFSVLFTSMYVGLYRKPYINLASLPSLIFVLLVSLVIGTILFVLLVLLINYSIKRYDLVNTNYFKTKFSALVLIIFVFFSIFTFQPYSVTKNSNYLISSPPIVSQDYTKVAYVIWNSNHPINAVYYLVVTNLITKNSSYYKFGGLDELVGFYNNSIIIYQNDGNFYSFNLLTGKTGSTFTSGSTININSNSGVKFANVQDYTQLNANGTAQLFIGDYLHQLNYRIINLTNVINGVGGFYLDVSPDISKAVLINAGYFYFYTINGLNSTFVRSIKIPFIQNSPHFTFLTWSNPSVIYFYDSNSSLTRLYYFNFTNQKFGMVASINKSITITDINENQSIFITSFPVEIYHYENSLAYLEQTTAYRLGVWNTNVNKSILYNFEKIGLFNLDSKTDLVQQNQLLYVAPSTNELNLLLSIYNINVGIVIYLVLSILFYYYREHNELAELSLSNYRE